VLHRRRSIDDAKKYWISRYPSKKISSHPRQTLHHSPGSFGFKEFSSAFNEVMQAVTKVVNFVKSRDLNCWLFKDLCSTENAEHSTLLLYTAVRWLSRGNTLKRVFILRNEVKVFCTTGKMKMQLFFQMICSLLALRSWPTFLRNWMCWIFHCKVEANGCLHCKLPFVLLLTSWPFSSREQKLMIWFVSILQGIFCNTG